MTKPKNNSQPKPLKKTPLKSKRKTKPNKTSRAVRSQRSLHKRLLLHPISIFGLIVVGVLIVGLTISSYADNYTVSAKVQAPALSVAAIINFPLDHAIVAGSPVTVNGSCPTDSYVDLIRDGAFSGVAYCSNNQTFSITTDLSLGLNTLQAQDYNVTNQPGHVSSSISITYEPPNLPSQPAIGVSPNQLTPEAIYPGSNTPSKTVVVPAYDNAGHGNLLLTSSYYYQSFITGHEYNWVLNLSGGKPPYFVSVDWGDNATSSLVFDSDPQFQISHSYQNSGNYNIVVQTIDSTGVKVVLQLTAVVKIKNIASTTQGIVSGLTPAGGKGGGSNLFSSAKRYLGIIWPCYIVIMLMVASFWLGERQEYRYLTRNRRARHG